MRSSEKRKSEKQEEAGARKGRKVAIHRVFPMIWGSGGLKSNLAKAAGAEPAGQMKDQKLHGVVARSTFRSQNVQNTPTSDQFLTFRYRNSVRRCGAKHISKSKCMLGPLLEVEMSKKCTPLWREARFQVKSVRCRKSVRRCGAKHISQVKSEKLRFGPLLDVQMSKVDTD